VRLFRTLVEKEVSKWRNILTLFVLNHLAVMSCLSSRHGADGSYLVFHGGSGSTKDEIREAVVNGVVKMNVDTDTQWAYLTGIRDFIQKKKDYLQSQVGNPEGADKPNKKQYDPRVWVREGEKTLSARVKEACEDLGNSNRN
jgi:fructose-bisphosphate aldolase class II